MKPKTKFSDTDKLLYLSIFTNVVCFIIICIIFFKKSKHKQQQLNVEKQSSLLRHVVIDSQDNEIQKDKYTQVIPTINIIFSEQEKETQTDFQLDKKHISIEYQKQDQFNLLLENKKQEIRNLRQQLLLEQERSQYLQQNITQLKQNNNLIINELRQVKQHRCTCFEPTMQLSYKQDNILKEKNNPSDQIKYLKNQLQFCQQLILQHNETQKQLKNKLQEYQKIGQISLVHPQFIRLRQKNKLYKETILQLQKNLLQGYSDRSNPNFSFTSD